MVANPSLERAKPRRIETACPHSAHFFRTQQAGVLKNLQMLPHRRQGDPQRLSQTRHRQWTIHEPVENGTSRGIPERVEQTVNIERNPVYDVVFLHCGSPASSFPSRSSRARHPA